MTSAPTVVLLGNPNAGKTTLFNALTGLRAKVGNYPGITMDVRAGDIVAGDQRVQVIDLPGTYSLAPHSDDEAVAVRVVLGRLAPHLVPHHIVLVLDATHLERHLYLAAQLERLQIPYTVALTMTDTLDAEGGRLDVAGLAQVLGRPVYRASGNNPDEVQAFRQRLLDDVRDEPLPAVDVTPLWYRALVEVAGAGDAVGSDRPGPDVDAAAVAKDAVDGLARRATEIADQVLTMPDERPRSERRTDAIDRVMLHPVAGPMVFVVLFGLLFQALFTWAAPLMDGIDLVVGGLGELLVGYIPDDMPLSKSLFLDGVVSGVGNVLVFVPQIAILFLALSLLEDSGLLARVAFLLDRVMSRVGLHGRAFVPFLSGFACAVPAIMATRAISSHKDRLTTIMVTPLISCSARLPVYTLIIATVFATAEPVLGINVGTWILFGAYGLSVGAALAIAFVFKRTLLKSPVPSLVLELPVYRRPRLGQAAKTAAEKSFAFLRDAGTIIFAITLVLWALFTFPRDDAAQAQLQADVAALDKTAEDAEEREQALRSAHAAHALDHSVAGRLGHALEPVLSPLGFDWKIGVGVIASFAAREVFVSTMGLVYGLGDGTDEESVSLKHAIQNDTYPNGEKVYTPLTGLSLIVFFVLAMQCMSTLAATRRETRSYRWPVFQFAYMTALAYVASLITFQVGRLLGFG